MRGNIQRPFYFCSFLKWAQGALRRRHPSEEPGHIAQMERLFFYGKFSTMDEADWLRNEISICQNGLRTSKPGVQASPVTGKPLLASVAGHLNFQGVESPETVDAVGFQPTASILSAKVGGLEGIRTLDLSDAKRFRKLFWLVSALFSRFRWSSLHLQASLTRCFPCVPATSVVGSVVRNASRL